MHNVYSLLHKFEGAVEQGLDKLADADAISASTYLASELEHLLPLVIEIGKEASSILTRDGEVEMSDLTTSFLTLFEWADRAKHYLLLWRNSAIQSLKAEVLFMDAEVQKEGVEKLYHKTIETLKTAFTDLNGLVRRHSHDIKKDPNKNTRQIQKWKLQINPWSEYEKQFDQLGNQASYLKGLHRELSSRSKAFREIRSSIIKTVEYSRHQVEEYLVNAQEAINFLETHLADQPAKVASYLEDLMSDLKFDDLKVEFTRTLHEYLDALGKPLRLPTIFQDVAWEKEIDFRRSTQRWLESEVLPSLYEMWDLHSKVANGMKTSIANVRNRCLLLQSEQNKGEEIQSTTTAGMANPIILFMEKTGEDSKEIKRIQWTINRRLERRFTLAKLYNPNELFLSSPFERSLNPAKFERSPLVVNARAWLDRQVGLFRDFQSVFAREKTLSNQEKVVRYVRSRTIDPRNHAYSNIFLTKGYLGDSFCVGRQVELERTENLISQWRNGFRGALLLSGQRLCGKTLMGRLILNRFASGQSLSLAANQPIRWQGRSLPASYKFRDYVEFLRKHGLNTKTLVWIDDIETWSDQHHSLSDNVSDLLRLIDSPAATSLFVIVSISNWMAHHLTASHGLRDVFQSEINLDRMSSEEIREAIAIRHGATHKVLVQENGVAASPVDFRRMTKKVYYATDGNIGESLSRWAEMTNEAGEDMVRFTYLSENPLPDFMDADTATILSTIMRYRRINEYRMRKMFGPNFSSRYSIVIQRLINMGVLTRTLQGQLEVKEQLANQIARLLDAKKYLKFRS